MREIVEIMGFCMQGLMVFGVIGGFIGMIMTFAGDTEEIRARAKKACFAFFILGGSAFFLALLFSCIS